MPIQINEDGTVTVTGEEAQTLIDGLRQEISTVPVSQISSTELEQVVSTEGPNVTQTTVDGIEILVQTVSDSIIKDMYVVDHGGLLGLNDDDHPQYHTDDRADLRYTPLSHIQSGVNPHGLTAPQLPGISEWGLRVTPADLAFIEANMSNDAIPSTRIASLVAGKIAAGTLAARISMADTFTASQNGSVLNDDQVLLGAGNPRIEMGFITDVNATYMLRHHNGYADNHPSYQSNFSIDSLGNLKLKGNITIDGGLGIGNFSDAGALATRDTQIYFSPTAPVDPILGDLWYDTDDGNAPYRYNGVTWDSVKDADIAVALGALDGKVQTYWQATEPTGLTAADNGDLWFDTSNGNHLYVYDDSAVPKWQDAQDSGIGQAISDASTAQSTADGKVTTYVGTAGPLVIEGIGDLFYDTDDLILYRANTFPVNSSQWTASEWDIVGNGFNDTGLLTDGAQLGQTADWPSVTGTGRPEDNADVTDVGARNLVLRGLLLPNQTVGSITQGVAGLGNWSFTLPDSSLVTQQMIFDLPPLKVDTNYVLTFWAAPSVSVGTDMVVELFPAGLPDFTVAMTDTGYVKYQLLFNSSDAQMANAILRFNKYTASTNATESITVYDVKLEEGTQPTDWSPFDAGDDIQQGVTAKSGGITLDSGGAIKSLGKDSWDDVTGGFFLGWDDIQSDYTFAIGNGTKYITWDGTDLTITGGLTIGAGESVQSGKTSYADTTAGFWIGSDAGTPKINIGDATDFMKWTGSALEITGSLNLGTSGQTLQAGQTAYDTGTGFFLGYDVDAYKLSIGNASGNKLTWDGTELALTGRLSASTILNAGTFTTTLTPSFPTTLDVEDTSDFAASGSGSFISITSYTPAGFTYTGKTATTLTGVSGIIGGGPVGSAVVPTNAGDENVFLWGEQDRMYFYGNQGSGTIEPNVIIGANSGGSTNGLLLVGNTTSGNNLAGVVAKSYSATGVDGRSWDGNGAYFSSVSGYGVRVSTGFSGTQFNVTGVYSEISCWGGQAVSGFTQSLNGINYGVKGEVYNATAGLAGIFRDGAGDGPLYLIPSGSTTPSHNAQKGTIWIGSGGGLFVNNNGAAGWSQK